LQDWYSLISEKRAWRIDLLKFFCRAFDYDVSKKTTVSLLGSGEGGDIRKLTGRSR
jgi:hypothetical protein